MTTDVAGVRGTVKRGKAEGYSFSEYALRLWIKQGLIPVRYAGNKTLVYWPNVRDFITCANGSDNPATVAGVRKVEQ